MSELNDRFDKRIKDENFNILELSGFKADPNLAIKTGMALGYQMAIKEVVSHLPSQKTKRESCLTIIQCDKRYEGCFDSCPEWQPPAGNGLAEIVRKNQVKAGEQVVCENLKKLGL